MVKSPLIHIKNVFLLLRYFNFCSDFFGYVGQRVDKKSEVNIKINDAINWETITIHILPNILRSKGNYTMKFGQLIEYNVKNIFLQKSCRR